ncbi:MAG TPA: hypothetical protein VN046_10620 [Stenotrophobium sp.]|jgi:hypothetical protein|nr:hypothetical protein [Stenotrophobium sp.]
MRGRTTTIALLWIAAAGIALYWISYFTGGQVQASDDGCYHVFERNFPLPDGFVALCAVLCALNLRRGTEQSLLWGLLTAGGFFFLGFIDIAYNLWNGMYAIFSAAMAAEIVINLFSLGFALWLSAFFWRNRRSWLR